jgi:hypothetical protein
MSVSKVPAPSAPSSTVTSDSRSGVDRHAQVNTNFSFGTTSPYVPLTSCCSPSGDRYGSGRRIGFRVQHLHLPGAEPTGYFFRLRPGSEGLFRRRLDTALDREARLAAEGWLARYDSSSHMPRGDLSCSDQKRSAMAGPPPRRVRGVSAGDADLIQPARIVVSHAPSESLNISMSRKMLVYLCTY